MFDLLTLSTSSFSYSTLSTKMADDRFSTPQNIINQLIHHMSRKIDLEYKQWCLAYLKQVHQIRGVRMQELRHILQLWQAEWDLYRPSETSETKFSVALLLISSVYYEDKLAGMLLISEKLVSSYLDVQHLSMFDQLFEQGHLESFKICDHFASKVLQPLIVERRSSIANHIATWFDATSFWQARTALSAFSLLARDAVYDDILLIGCEKLVYRPQDEAKNCVASALKAIGKNRGQLVQTFLQNDEHLINLTAQALGKAASCLESSLPEQFKTRRRALINQRRTAEAAAAAAGTSNIQQEPIVSVPGSTQMVVPIVQSEEVTQTAGNNEFGLNTSEQTSVEIGVEGQQHETIVSNEPRAWTERDQTEEMEVEESEEDDDDDDYEGSVESGTEV